MRFKTVLVTLFLSAIATSCNYVFAQANVVENQTIYLYVNAQTGSDSDPGTASSPLKTIQAAVAKALINNSRGAGTRIEVAPGVYRELVQIGYSYGMTGAPITIEATTIGTAIIDGADVLTGIREINSARYVASWKDNVEPCPLPNGWPTTLPPITLHREMVFINGQSLTQVLDPTRDLPGTFYVNQQYQSVVLWPPTGTDMATALVEIANRPQTLIVQDRSNMVFRGLVFQHGASCMNQSSAEVFSSQNVLFDRVQANWNNWSGMDISGSNYITVQGSTGSYNGGAGLSAFEDLNSLFQNNETDYNNWRGGMGALYDFSQSGTKLMRMHSVQVLQQSAYNNLAQGLWFDTDNKNVAISNAILSGSLLSNLQLEANEGPITVQNSTFCAGGAGIIAVNTEGITVTGSTFNNNGGTVPFLNGQFYLAGKPGGRSVVDWQTGQSYLLYTSNTKMQGNNFTSVGTQQFVFNTYLSGTDWTEFSNSLSSGNNGWFDATQPTDFGVPDGKRENLSGWQNLTGQDLSSYWGTSLTTTVANCLPPTPVYPDFNVYAHNTAAFLPVYYMSNGTIAINIGLKSFGFGTVHLSTDRLPSGVSASFSSPTLTSGNSVLTLKASSSATSETVPVTVFAVSGSRVHTVTFSVAIRPI